MLLGDCLDIMSTLTEHSVDAVITDLPYGTTQNVWDTIIPFEPMWLQVKRLLKANGSFVTTCSQPFTSMLVMSNLKDFKYEWIWNKITATGHLNAHNRPMLQHENIVVFYAHTAVYNPQDIQPYNKLVRRGGNGSNYGSAGTSNIQEFTNYPRTILSMTRNTSKLHPTQKNVALYEYLIRTYTNPCDVVLDIAAGSGTTGIAAINTGRSAILIEKDAAYFDVMVKRIDKHLEVL
jgi:site-specific DNA-methyltransferase (adenine-specific)